MSMSIEKKIDNIMGQIDLIDIADANVMVLKMNVLEEWNTLRDFCKHLPKGRHLELKRMLHATRAFDTGLRMFLEKHGGFRGTMPSIGGYVRELQRGRTSFTPLNGNVADRINRGVTDVRNKYMHSANCYPGKNETDRVLIDILQYYNLVLGLVK